MAKRMKIGTCCQLQNCSLLNVIFQQCTECVDVAVCFSARSDEKGWGHLCEIRVIFELKMTVSGKQ